MGAGGDGAARRDDSVGANEPVYCVCRQIGWGDMVSPTLDLNVYWIQCLQLQRVLVCRSGKVENTEEKRVCTHSTDMNASALSLWGSPVSHGAEHPHCFDMIVTYNELYVARSMLPHGNGAS